MRDEIFISYASDNRDWLEKFRKNLDPLEAKGLLKVWADNKLTPGANWYDEIRGALGRARVALLLVTPDFINSTFIRNEELRALFRASDDKQLLLWWVPLAASLSEVIGLDKVQAAPGCDPKRPLNLLDEAHQQQAIVTICRALLDEMGQIVALTSGDRIALKQRVSARLRDRYELGDEIGTGSTTIVYKARSLRPQRPVAVKTLVTSELQGSAESEFRRRAEVSYKLTDPAYIQVYETLLEEEPYCVVTEYVDGCTLDRYLCGAGRIPAPRVRDMLLQLARALAQAHREDVLHEGLLPSNVHVSDDGRRMRLGGYRFLSIGPDAGMWGTFLVNHETCTYMSPEQFGGSPRTKASDQYALGLLGYELLSGERLEPIKRPSDFVTRPRTYARLEDGEWTDRHPGLRGFISRMLRVDPARRWGSMDEVVAVLEDMHVVEATLDETRSKVVTSYSSFQANNQIEQLYRHFYDRLFQVAPDVRALFRKDDMKQQYHALNRALMLLIEYDPAKPATGEAIDTISRRHCELGVSDRHLDAFEQVLGEALVASCGIDMETLSAWHTVICGGLDRMRRQLRPASPRSASATMAAAPAR